ncbi:MAG: YjbQ family protein [Candidatus Omnitrophota bacterium]|jgi:secondary thiamine-phosphate synthase enzyme|nr:MAG: YjbQ family protein [Candidatus Omnitrophota bacterium]
MKIVNETLSFKTRGNPDLINITADVAKCLGSKKFINGSIILFVIGSTAALTTFEYEPGMIKDIQEIFEKLVPSAKGYHHDQTWGDANGFSHIRSALVGPSLTIPFKDAELLLGTWQQIVLLEFDNRPRQRKIAVQIIGE